MSGPFSRARYEADCQQCLQRILPGDPIGRYGDKWAHADCVIHQKAVGAILAGRTFKAGRRTSWKR